MPRHSPKYVLITGAAKGIGRATTELLAAHGWHILTGVRRQSDGEELKQAIKGQITPVIVDVTDAETIKAAAAQVEAITGSAGLAGLVNNAGVVFPAPLEFIPIDALREQLEVNVVGQLAVTQAMLPALFKAKGRIINVSSINGRIATPLVGAYAASKFALEALTDTLRVELKSSGVEVISVQPGATITPIWETSTATADQLLARMPAAAQEKYSHLIEGLRKRAAARDKIGTPPQVVAAAVEKALTAARPKTRYVTGKDARFAARFIAPLPDRWRDALLMKFS